MAIAWFINFFWKISVHSIGVGGINGLLIGISRIMEAEITPLLFLSVLIAGLVGFARLKLNAHNYSQVYTGFLLGFFTILGTLMITTL